MTGASGLIGTAFSQAAGAAGHRVTSLVRRRPRGPDEFAWDPAAGTLDHSALDGADAVVHLAGEPLAEHRWTAERKRRILESRVQGTGLVARSIAAAPRPPRVLISASAIGIYGSRGDETLDERSAPGRDFLAHVCEAWEAETAPASLAGVRVVTTRFGVVLTRRGGALARQLPFFRAGVGSPIGNGRQWMSCVALDDLTSAMLHILSTDTLRGPVNVVCPEPVRNAQFTRLLGRLLHRPAFFPVPVPLLRILLGELADVVLAASQRVTPAALTAGGYVFRHPTVHSALSAALGERAAG
jgi:uncharacterized protein (TIGR01777 family)